MNDVTDAAAMFACFALLVWICMLNRGGLHIHHSLLLLLFLFLSLSPLRSFYVHHTTRF